MAVSRKSKTNRILRQNAEMRETQRIPVTSRFFPNQPVIRVLSVFEPRSVTPRSADPTRHISALRGKLRDVRRSLIGTLLIDLEQVWDSLTTADIARVQIRPDCRDASVDRDHGLERGLWQRHVPTRHTR
jgi:hypothetical protein